MKLLGTKRDQALLFVVAISTVFYMATAIDDATSETDDVNLDIKGEVVDSTLTRRKRDDASPIDWKVDGEVNWADYCEFYGQDFDHMPNTKKEACGQLCLANPLCDHFTWDNSNGNCWLKKWSGSQGPTVNPAYGSRCGFVQRGGSTTVQPPKTTTQEPPGSPQSTIAATQRPSTEIVWKMDGEVNWADGCDYWSQDFTYVANTKKEACGSICLANPKCDHFTRDVLDNGKCWLKRWVGDQPRIQQDGRRCGVIPNRIIDIKALKEAVAGLIATVSEQQSQISALQSMQKPVGGPMAASCADLRQLGHMKSGFYAVKSPSNENKLRSVYCNFTLQAGTKGFETVIGYNDIKTGSGVHFYVQRNSHYDTIKSVIPYQIERLNIGSGMNLTSGIFTAPVNGLYHFIFTAVSLSVSNSNAVQIRLNGVAIGTGWATSTTFNLPIVATLNLKKSDRIDSYLAEGSIQDSFNLHTQFSGILLEEDLVF